MEINMLPMNRIETVVVLHLESSGRFLLGKRKNPFGQGHWSAFGGKVDYGERVLEALVREMKEELNLDLNQDFQGKKLLTRVKRLSDQQLMPNTNLGKHQIIWNYYLELPIGVNISNAEPDKCETLGWFDWSDLPEPIMPALKELKVYSPEVFPLGNLGGISVAEEAEVQDTQIVPVGYRVLLLQDEKETKTEGGIILPDNVTKPVRITGRILRISNAIETSMKHSNSFNEGDRVLFDPRDAIPVSLETTNRMFIVGIKAIVANFPRKRRNSNRE